MNLTRRFESVRPALTAAIGASLLLLAAYPAHAGLEDNPPSMKVRFGDLDLNKDEGIQELYRRIRGAARTVCNKAVPDFLPLSIRGQWQCYRSALGNAVAQLNNSRLTALHRQQSEAKRPG